MQSMQEKVNRTLHYKEHISPEEEKILREGLFFEATLAKKMKKITPFGFFIKDDARKILAGITGNSYYGCLYIDMLWVDPFFRKKGWGRELVHAAENLARKRKCTFISLTTMDWEALDFYKNMNYAIEYTRKGFEKDSTMYVLRKDL